jgi:hypothetical protein
MISVGTGGISATAIVLLTEIGSGDVFYGDYGFRAIGLFHYHLILLLTDNGQLAKANKGHR